MTFYTVYWECDGKTVFALYPTKRQANTRYDDMEFQGCKPRMTSCDLPWRAYVHKSVKRR